MKIISNYKDYYDYLAGTFGVDPKIVYERQLGYKLTETDKPQYHESKEYELYVLGKYYMVVIHKEQVYITIPELTELYESNILSDSLNNALKGFLKEDTKWWMGGTRKNIEVHRASEINLKDGRPVLMQDTSYDWRAKKYLVPRLKDFNFHKILSPEEIYLQLTDWLSYKEPEIITKPEDMSRFESKGFDKRTSFRKM